MAAALCSSGDWTVARMALRQPTASHVITVEIAPSLTSKAQSHARVCKVARPRTRTLRKPFLLTVMERSPLGRLPAETRTAIDEYALCLDQDLVIAVNHSTDDVSVNYETGYGSPILKAFLQLLTITKICQQAYTEARPVLFAVNTWCIHTGGVVKEGDSARWQNLVIVWIGRLGGGAAYLFRTMAIFIPVYRHQHLNEMEKFRSLYLNLSGCFDVMRTMMSFKMMSILIPQVQEGLFADDFEDVEVCFAMTPMLSRQLNAQLIHIKSGFAEGKRHAGGDFTVEDLEILEDDALEKHDLLRRFVDCVQRHGRSQSTLS